MKGKGKQSMKEENSNNTLIESVEAEEKVCHGGHGPILKLIGDTMEDNIAVIQSDIQHDGQGE